MAVFSYSRVAAYNPNTSPTSVARSASGSVYDIGDTGFLTPLNLTLVATNTVTTTLVSDANAMFPDFTLVDRTSCVFKSGSTAMVLTTTTPIPGPTGSAGTAGKSIASAALSAGNLVLTLSDSTTLAPVPLPTGAAIDDSSAAYLVGSGTLTKAALNATYASYVNLAKNPDTLIAGAVTVDGSNYVTSATAVWPDGTPGTLTITSRDATGGVLAYNITYGSPVTKTFTQPTITRNTAGAATNVPQIVVS